MAAAVDGVSLEADVARALDLIQQLHKCKRIPSCFCSVKSEALQLAKSASTSSVHYKKYYSRTSSIVFDKCTNTFTTQSTSTVQHRR